MTKFIVPALLVILVILQGLYLSPSLSQIRPEELSESIQRSLWLDHGQFIPGTSVLIGFYLPLQILYHIFGFSFWVLKLFRFGLQIVSLICLAKLLKKHLVPLITIGLSPTILFFNTLGVPYGIELQYLPILIYLLLQESLLAQILFVVFLVLAATSYSGFISLIPPLGLLYLLKSPYFKKHHVKGILISVLIAVLTVGILVFQIQDKQSILFAKKGGLLSGAGSLTFNIQGASQTILGLIKPIDPYYYEPAKPEFSDWYPLLALIATTVISIYSFKKHRVIIGIASLAILINILSLATLSSPTGLINVRRAAGLLAGIYTLYAVSWAEVFSTKTKFLKYVFIGCLLLLPLHHLLAYIPNYQNLTVPSPNREEFWFHRFGTPAESLKVYMDRLTKSDLKLKIDYPGMNFTYTYNWAYSTLTSNCVWNHIKCHSIYGFDPQTNTYILLDFETVYRLLDEFNADSTSMNNMSR
jgi:hypothetical protein